MKDNFGFKRYDTLVGQSYIIPEEVEKVSEPVRSQQDILFDKIFACDDRGWPTSSMAVYLSEKTSEDIRRFIEQNLMQVKSQPNLIDDPKILAEYNKLESSFIAECSRNRFESVQDYEKRLQDIIHRQDGDSYSKKFYGLIKNFKGDK